MHPPRIIPAARILRADAAPTPGRFFAGITAAAVALSLVLGSALPAHADKRGDDLAKALLGIIVLGAIVNEIKKDDPKPAPVPVHKKKKHKAESRRIPAVCAIQIEGKSRSVTVYPETCLRDEGIRGKLPRHCSHEARIYGQWDRIYGVDCLREAGFDVRESRGH